MAVYAPPPTITIRYTSDVATNGINTMVYGLAGTGKTRLLATAPHPLIISAENGLLSLKKLNVPYIQIGSMAELIAVYNLIVSGDSRMAAFWTICLDSVSEIAEAVLAYEMATNTNGQRAYGEMASQVMDQLRKFRDIPNRHIVFIAKQGRFVDQATGMALWGPLMPGKQLDQQLPYLFDEVLQLNNYTDPANGNVIEWLRTRRDNQNEAKDRSGLLFPAEPANLAAIFQKIQNG